MRSPLHRETYVGDDFTLTFSSWDDHPRRRLNGEAVKLLGFNNKVKIILPHMVSYQIPEPGFYRTLGDPVVKHDYHGHFPVPLINLAPEGYRFTDNIPKNRNYLNEIRKLHFLKPLPSIAYNIGDKILVAAHGRFKDDFFSQILDVAVGVTDVHYIIEHEGRTISISESVIIDALDRGEFSDLERFGILQRSTDRFVQRRILGQPHHDSENITDYDVRFDYGRDMDPETD